MANQYSWNHNPKTTIFFIYGQHRTFLELNILPSFECVRANQAKRRKYQEFWITVKSNHKYIISEHFNDAIILLFQKQPVETF